MSLQTIKDFLKELDAICDLGKAGDRMQQTRELLEVADQLFEGNKVITNRIKDGSFLPNICGTTRIEENVDNVIVKRPVVDLVQQGGTMLGIGLLGYTYIMEKAGVRFRHMAGTSAGAINTLLLSALPEKIYREKSPFSKDGRQAVKSELLAYLVANTDFSKFLDRKGTIGWLQCRLVKRINMINKILPVLKIILPVLMLGLSFLIYQFLDKHLFNSANNLTENQINVYNFITGTLGIMAILLLVIVLLFSLFKKNMGVNPGDAPYRWIKSILETNYVDIKTTDELIDRKKNETKPKYDTTEGTTGVLTKDPRLVFISANLTHNRIVKFPENNVDYWNKEYAGLVCPAAYVRASMSLPFIFYAFIPSDEHIQVRDGERPSGTVDMLARFIDGGLLSNFPIREFHTALPEEPKYPTFGVLLGSPAPEPGRDTDVIKEKFLSQSVFKFILSFISTFRNFYDSDFLRSHQEFSLLVKAVNTHQFNSLDFGMGFETKKKIFSEGAKTAIDQLEHFNWNEYLAVRMGKTAKTGI